MLVIDGGFRISASDDGTFETNRETFLLFTQCFHRMREREEQVVKNHILQIFCWHWPSFKDSCWTFSLSCCIQSCINEQQCLNLERTIFHTEPPLIQTIYTTASILILWDVQQKYFKMQHNFSHNNPVFSLYSTKAVLLDILHIAYCIGGSGGGQEDGCPPYVGHNHFLFLHILHIL